MRWLTASGRVIFGLMLSVGGLLTIGFGGLFMLQGAGVVRWPASSFMIGNGIWIVGGLVIVIVGVAELVVARRWLTPTAASA